MVFGYICKPFRKALQLKDFFLKPKTNVVSMDRVQGVSLQIKQIKTTK